MNRQMLTEYALRLPGVTLRYPFDPQLPVLFVGSKMFALLGWTGDRESVNLKADPEEAWLLRQQYPRSVLPGYHMNKKHWNTVVLDGTVPDGEILVMLEQSYRLVKAKLTRKEREEIAGG
ncbi:MmcQ/YjbR family DNA-binding protein [Cohnella sp. CFH 77786]|uniref:MmcQ/YjbR family DNA-binding protein n=1 Tax=Cohnella sp. CFH 77786 TaxID=2662265 RepID=UPI001C610FE4|nr:MmcQ/YjbR family DNA-binding protein [Cohnella sp. CFH 77786]MBW5448492.1 MmcQ/YjbR family DNA-binding protein [Cohnella sp. CFH 77786]